MIPAQPLQRILSALSQQLEATEVEEEVSDSLSALLHLLQSEDVRDTVLSKSGDANLVELCRDLIAGLSKAVRKAENSSGLIAVAVFDALCQNEKARQLLLQHSDTEPIFERIPQLLAGMPNNPSIPLSVAPTVRTLVLSVAHITRYPTAQRRVLASGRCTALLAGLNQLMLCTDSRIASDAASAVGNIAFNDEGRYQVLAYKSLDEVVAGLLHILKAPEEFAGNAAWAIGNLCRDEKWCGKMLEQPYFVREVVKGMSNLVASTDVQTACDWTCAIAMITRTTQGAQQLLQHTDSELLLVNLLRNAASADTRLLNSACLALRNLKSTCEGLERYNKTVTLVSGASAGRPFEMIDQVVEEVGIDKKVGANAALLMRGFPAEADRSLAGMASRGKRGYGVGEESPVGAETAGPVRRDRVCLKSLDGAVLRSLPICLLTEEAVMQDSRLAPGDFPAFTPDYPVINSQSLENVESDKINTKIHEAISDAVSGGAAVLGVAAAPMGVPVTAPTHGKADKPKRSRDEFEADDVAEVVAESEEDGSKAGEESGKGCPAPPGHPANCVFLESCDETSLTVSWVPVFPDSTDSCRFVCDGGNGGSYRNVATVTREEISEGGKYFCRIDGLKPGRDYRVLAIAKTRFKPCHGAQTMFDTKATLRTKAAAPATPDTCVLSSRTRTSLKIRWVAPDCCGSAIDSYEVSWCRAAEEQKDAQEEGNTVERERVYTVVGEWEDVKDALGAKDLSWQMKKLGPGQHFGFRVRAANAEGKSLWSPAAFYSTAASVPSAPECIKNVSENNALNTAGKLVLEWDTPSSNGEGITAYVLEQQGSGGAWEVAYNGPETRFTVGGLMAGSTYKFRVKASNNIGSGEYSPALEATGVAAAPGPCDAPTLVKAKATALSIRWAEPDCRGSEVRSYRVMLVEAGQDTAPTKKTKFNKVWQGAERTCECAGLSAGKPYFVRVVAINSVGESEPGAVATFQTTPDVPAPPQGLVLVSKGHMAAKVKWKSPHLSNGSAISAYRIEVEQVTDGSIRTINVSGQVCEHEITELQPERAYSVRVLALNKVGKSGHSDVLRITNALSPPAPPGAPRLIGTRPNGMTVRWDPPGAGVVEGYRVEFVPEGSDSKWLGHDVHGKMLTECRTEITGLRPGVSYKVKVIARNKSGCVEGTVAVLRTEAVTPAPTALQAQIVESENSLVAHCSWVTEGAANAPLGGQLTFHVEVDDGGEGSADFKQVYVGPKAQFSLPVQAGKSYKFRVRAVSSLGNSAWSVIKGFSRALPSHGIPEGVTVRLLEDGRTACLVWSPPASGTATAYQVRVNLQEGKKRRVDEGLEYRRDDLDVGHHRFQVRAMVGGKWSDWSRDTFLSVPPSNHSSSSKRVAVGGLGGGKEAVPAKSGMERFDAEIPIRLAGDAGTDVSDPLSHPSRRGAGAVAVVGDAGTDGGDSFAFASNHAGGGQAGAGVSLLHDFAARDLVAEMRTGRAMPTVTPSLPENTAAPSRSGQDIYSEDSRLMQDLYAGASTTSTMTLPAGGNWGPQVPRELLTPGDLGAGSGVGIGAVAPTSITSNGDAFSLGGTDGQGLFGRGGVGLGGLKLGEEEDPELMAIPSGLLDEDFGNGIEEDLGFFSMGAGSTGMGGDQGASRFSLWGMPLDAPALSYDATFDSEVPYSSTVGAASTPQFAGLSGGLHGGAGQRGVVGTGVGAVRIGMGHGSGVSTPSGNENSQSTYAPTYVEDDFDPLGRAWPAGLGIGGGTGGTGVNRGGNANMVDAGLMCENGTGGGGEASSTQGSRGTLVPVTEIVRDLVSGTCFVTSDIDQKHREMMTGLMAADAKLLVDLARPQFLASDKSSLREQQGAFIHQVLQKAKQQMKRQLAGSKAGAGINADRPRGSMKVDLKGEPPHSPLRQALSELCQGTCVDLSDVDKQVSFVSGAGFGV